MEKRKINNIVFVVLFMVIFTLFFGLFCRFVVKADTTEQTTELFTSEEQEAIYKANHLTDEEHEAILNASRKLLEEIGDVGFASSTDADFDTHAYLTYNLDQEWFDNTTPTYKMLDDIYRMILSIRNLLLVLIIGFVVVWVHKMVKSFILSFSKGGRSS